MFGLGLSCISNPTANASEPRGGLLIEPAITDERGDGSIISPSPIATSSAAPSGFGLGARIGLHVSKAFFVGMDFRYAMPRFKDLSASYDTRSISINWGPVVGMQMPTMGMRVWGSYIIDGELNPESNGYFDVRFLNASGYRVGSGFRLASVALNIEYQQIKYGQALIEHYDHFLPNANYNNASLENKTWIASLSFPLEL